MPAKIESFREWIPAEHASYGDAFMEVVMHGFGKSRQFHIRTFYQDILRRDVSEAFLQAEVDRFTAICEPKCEAAGWRVGSEDFVKACRDAVIPRYVLSGTPQKPLEEMLSSTGADVYFDVIIGSPPQKPESMERILQEVGVSADRTVFVGDANADHVAALHVGAHFVYFPSEAPAPKAPVETTVNDLRELLV